MPPIGLITRAVILLGILAALGLVAHYIYEAGGDAREAPWLKRESQRNLDLAKKLGAAQREARAAEIKAVGDVAMATANANRELRNVQAKSDRFVDDVLAGRVRVFVNPAGNGSGTGGVSSAGASVGGQAGTGACELPRSTVVDLGNLARDADQTAVALNECRESCLKMPPQTTGACPTAKPRQIGKRSSAITGRVCFRFARSPRITEPRTR
jgi:hypothetical protein